MHRVIEGHVRQRREPLSRRQRAIRIEFLKFLLMIFLKFDFNIYLRRSLGRRTLLISLYLLFLKTKIGK